MQKSLDEFDKLQKTLRDIIAQFQQWKRDTDDQLAELKAAIQCGSAGSKVARACKHICSQLHNCLFC